MVGRAGLCRWCRRYCSFGRLKNKTAPVWGPAGQEDHRVTLSLAGLIVRLSAARKGRTIVQLIYGRGVRQVAKGYRWLGSGVPKK
jgi:hypothetical protein